MAVASTRSKRVAVIGTPATVNSNAYARAIHALDPEVRIFSQACPLFVPLVEEGWVDHPVTRMVAQEYLRPVLAEQVDTLVLGCTHYPLLKGLLQDVAGPEVRLIDSAEAPRYTFYVTDVPLRFRTLGERFLGRALPNVHVVRW
jgi:glutamate racemase